MLRAYLNRASVEEKQKTLGLKPSTAPFAFFGEGFGIRREDDRIYLDFNDLLGAEIPSGLVCLVEEFSYRDSLPRPPKRSLGVYRRGAAEATLDRGGDYLLVRIRGEVVGEIKSSWDVLKVLRDVRDLYLMIRAGTITPVVSWEAEQVRPAFHQRLQQALRILRG